VDRKFRNSGSSHHRYSKRRGSIVQEMDPDSISVSRRCRTAKASVMIPAPKPPLAGPPRGASGGTLWEHVTGVVGPGARTGPHDHDPCVPRSRGDNRRNATQPPSVAARVRAQARGHPPSLPFSARRGTARHPPVRPAPLSLSSPSPGSYLQRHHRRAPACRQVRDVQNTTPTHTQPEPIKPPARRLARKVGGAWIK
jgi:hypothetical protein